MVALRKEVPSRKRILVPLDGTGWSERAIPYAAELAHQHHAELVLLHIYREPAREFAPDIILAGQESQIDHSRDQVQNHFRGLRNELRQQNLDVDVQWIEGTGVTRQISDYINEQDVDMVVMATHYRKGLALALYGSVARDVIKNVHIPVTLITPEKDY